MSSEEEICKVAINEKGVENETKMTERSCEGHIHELIGSEVNHVNHVNNV